MNGLDTLFRAAVRFLWGALMRGWPIMPAILVGACASISSAPGELPTPPKRLQSGNISFLPPNEPGWFVAQRSPERLTLLKRGKLEGDAYLIEATFVALRPFASPAELTRIVRAQREKDAAAPRFRIKAHELSEQSIGGAQCILSYLLAEDRQANAGENIVTAMLVESVAVVCPRPHDRTNAIVLEFSHRSFPEDQDRALRARARPVVESLQFDQP